MPFIPHTQSDIQEMLTAIGVDSIEDLFDEIPAHLRVDDLSAIDRGVSEMQITRDMRALAAQDGAPLCFTGAGAYEHHIPAAVWELTTRGEFYSAYTPYQAEASQGTLQVIYEYQSMMTALMAMDVSNASLYDGATALAEAVLMAVRANRKSKSGTILMPKTVHPEYRSVVNSMVRLQDIRIEELPFDPQTGCLDPSILKQYDDVDVTAIVIPQPNFFGMLEQVDAVSSWAAGRNTMLIAQVNPTAMALLKPPGEWADGGADIVCGEGQPLGSPLSSGGPYFGFMCCDQSIVRQMPGRIVGKTTDVDGNPGFTLTLQAREQHIRRGKARSNICTNQGLLVTAATIYMSLLGAPGLARVARASHQNTHKLLQRVLTIAGVERVFEGTFFHEQAVRLSIPADVVVSALAQQNIVGGYSMVRHYPELGNTLLLCATETKTDADIETFATALERVLEKGA